MSDSDSGNSTSEKAKSITKVDLVCTSRSLVELSLFAESAKFRPMPKPTSGPSLKPAAVATVSAAKYAFLIG